MSARAVPCEVPAIKRNIVDGWQEPAGNCGRDAGRVAVLLRLIAGFSGALASCACTCACHFVLSTTTSTKPPSVIVLTIRRTRRHGSKPNFSTVAEEFCVALLRRPIRGTEPHLYEKAIFPWTCTNLPSTPAPWKEPYGVAGWTAMAWHPKVPAAHI
jgi:hypothetical protein